MGLLQVKHVSKAYKLAGREKVSVLRDVNVSFYTHGGHSTHA